MLRYGTGSKEGRGENGDEAPTNWRSNFGQNSSWTRVPNSTEWYHHVFAPEQPDLNWKTQLYVKRSMT